MVMLMRVVVADCSAIYTGRGDTQLPRGVRVLVIKLDGSVSIHNDVGNKPLNYMKGAVFSESFSDGCRVWHFDTRRESLAVTVYGVFSDVFHNLIEDDPGLVRDGTEGQLQVWLSENVHVFGVGYSLVGREFSTGNGPVDLLLLDGDLRPVSVEVKRVAMIGAVDQSRRYLDALRDRPFEDCGIDFSDVRGVIAALDIRPKTVDYAKRHGIGLVTVPSFWRDGSDVSVPVVDDSAAVSG